MMDGQNMMNGQNMMDCMGAMGAMGWATLIFWILLIALLAWGLYRLSTTSGSSARETPLETLQRRYAEGDISTEEYEERKRTLSQ